MTHTETSYEARLVDGTLVARARTRDLAVIQAEHNGHRLADFRITEVPRRS